METNNELIAEFMGAYKRHSSADGAIPEYDMYGIIPCIEDGENEKHFFTPDEMLFNKSWDWLMPAVARCWYHAIDGIDEGTKEQWARMKILDEKGGIEGALVGADFKDALETVVHYIKNAV